MDYDDFQNTANSLDLQGISLDSLSMDQLAEIMINAGIDLSQFSDTDLDQLLSLMSSDSLMSVDQLADIIAETGIDLSQLSAEQLDQLINLAHNPGLGETNVADSTSQPSSDTHGMQISFTGAGKCWWCSGSGVVWDGTQNQPCSHCGGSGIGPE